MDKPLAVAFTTVADMSWAVENGDGRHPMRHWRGKDLTFLIEANGAVFKQRVLDKMGVLILWKTRCSQGHLYSNSTLMPPYSKL